jgi:translocator protein
MPRGVGFGARADTHRVRHPWLGLAVWLAVTFVAAFIGSRFEPGAWYDGLHKPPWNPPDWVFGPVWTVLYILMGVAAWLVWKTSGWDRARGALSLYLIQVALNAAWSWIFFGLQRPGLALAEIVVLWLAIGATLLAFRRHVPLAAWLLAPYLAWVTFAAVLNLSLWRLNA